MAVDFQGLTGSPFQGLLGSEWARYPRSVSVVSHLFFGIRADLFRLESRLDESLGLPLATLDLCLKLRARGYRSLYTPFIQVSVQSTSGARPPLVDLFAEKRMKQIAQEQVGQMRSRWGQALLADPFCNPNLSLTESGVSLSASPVVYRPWERANSLAPFRAAPAQASCFGALSARNADPESLS